MVAELAVYLVAEKAAVLVAQWAAMETQSVAPSDNCAKRSLVRKDRYADVLCPFASL